VRWLITTIHQNIVHMTKNAVETFQHIRHLSLKCSGAKEIPKGSLLKQKWPFRVMKVVRSFHFSLSRCKGLCTSVTPRAMLAGAQAPSRATHVRQVKVMCSGTIFMRIVQISSLATACTGQPLLTFTIHTEHSWMFALIVADLKTTYIVLNLLPMINWKIL